MRLGNLTASVLIIALGIFMVFEAGKMNIGFSSGLQAGVFPRILGSGLGVLGLLLFLSEWLPSFRSKDTIEWPAGKYRVRVLLIAAAILLYIGTIKWIGFVLTTFLFVFFLTRLLGAYRWTVSASVSLLTTSSCTVVFQYWLDLKLPSGILGI